MDKKENIDLYQEIFNSYPKYSKAIVNTHIQKLKELDRFLSPSQSFFTLVNTTKDTYEFVSKNIEQILGFSIERMKNEGVSYWIKYIHPDDLKIWLKIIKELVDFTISEVSSNDREKISYTWNMRLQNTKGVYVNLHIHNTPVIFDKNGKPVIGISHNTVISENLELPIIASVKILNDNSEYETIFYKNYSQTAFTDLLTKRERDVLRLLALKKSSKEIGEKLFISSHTVDGHRRNIIKKTGLNSTGEIIQYCKSQQLF